MNAFFNSVQVSRFQLWKMEIKETLWLITHETYMPNEQWLIFTLNHHNGMIRCSPMYSSDRLVAIKYQTWFEKRCIINKKKANPNSFYLVMSSILTRLRLLSTPNVKIDVFFPKNSMGTGMKRVIDFEWS